MPILGGAGLVFIIVAIIIVFIIVSRFYQKASPNEALVISGRGRTPKIVVGGGTVVLPFIEKVDRFSLEIMTIDFKTPEVYTSEGVPVVVEAVAQVKVNSREDSVRTAVERFLSMSKEQIANIIQQTLEGHMRAIIGESTAIGLVTERDKFAQAVTEVSGTDLENMGLSIDSFSIKDITDNVGYLEAWGRQKIADMKAKAIAAQADKEKEARIKRAIAMRDAQIAEAEADKERNIKMKEAERDKRMQMAEADATAKKKELEAQKDVEVANAMMEKEKQVARAEAMKVSKIKEAEAKREAAIKQAEADKAYKIQELIMEQKAKEEEVKIGIIQKEKEVELQEKEALRKEKELEATIKKPAEAEKYRLVTLAEADKAKKIAEAQGKAEAQKAEGYAQAEVIKAKGTAEALAEKAKGLASADIIKAKGFAEAEAMEKKAHAWKQYNHAAVMQMFFDKLPEVVASVSAPLSKTEKIIMIGNGSDGVGVSKLTNDITNTIAQLPPVIQALTGMDLTDIIKNIPALQKTTTQTTFKTQQRPSSGASGITKR